MRDMGALAHEEDGPLGKVGRVQPDCSWRRQKREYISYVTVNSLFLRTVDQSARGSHSSEHRTYSCG